MYYKNVYYNRHDKYINIFVLDIYIYTYANANNLNTYYENIYTILYMINIYLYIDIFALDR